MSTILTCSLVFLFEVVFVGPYEHHSNLLPWKEMGATVHRIRETDNGLVDSEHLEELLRVGGFFLLS